MSSPSSAQTEELDPLAGLYVEEEEPDPLEGLYAEEEPHPEPNTKDPHEQFRQFDVTREELKNMSVWERLGQAELMNAERKARGESTRQAKGLAKGIASELTFTGSEYIDALKPQPDELLTGLGSAIGSIPYIALSGGAIGALSKAAQVATRFKIANTGLSAVAHIFGWSVAGAAEHGIKKAVQGEIPSPEDLLAHGAVWGGIETILQTIGGTYRVGKALVRGAEKAGITPIQELNKVTVQAGERVIGISKESPEYAPRVAEEALKVLQEQPGVRLTAEDLNKKMSARTFTDAAKETVPEAYKPGEVKFEADIEALEKGTLARDMDAVAERAASEQALGESVQKSVQESLEASKKEYKPWYTEAEAVAKDTVAKTSQPAHEAVSKLNEITSYTTEPAGYTRVTELLHEIIEDLGYEIYGKRGQYKIRPKGSAKIEKPTKPPEKVIDIAEITPEAPSKVVGLFKKPKKVVQFPKREAKTVAREKAAEAVATRAAEIEANKISTPKLMGLGRRVNETIDYEAVERSVGDILRPVVNSIKGAVRESLAPTPLAKEAYELAESLYAKHAQKYANETMLNLRGIQAPERIAKAAEAPTVLKALKATTSPQVYAQVERQVLERMNGMTHARAAEFYRNVSSHLSDTAKNAAKKILNFKAPHSHATRLRNLKTGVLDELGEALTTGERPQKTLKLWQNYKGRQLVKESIRNNPNRAEIEHYLSTQATQDFAASVIGKDGAINFKQLHELMKDPATVANLRDVGGEQAVQFFRRLEQRAEAFKQNAENWRKSGRDIKEAQRRENIKQPAPELPKFTKPSEPKAPTTGVGAGTSIHEQIGLPGRIALHAFAAWHLTIPTHLALIGLERVVSAMTKSPRVRQAFVEMTAKRMRPNEFLASLKAFERTLKEEETTQQE